MSKVKIQGHASGTGVLTVTAPNTSTDRTITLPDSTDTLAVNSDVTNKLPLAGGTMTGTLNVSESGNNAEIKVGTQTAHAHQGYSGVQFEDRGYIGGYPNDSLGIFYNTYHSSGSKAIETGTAANVQLLNGGIRFQTAPSVSADAAQTFTDAVMINTAGVVSVPNGIELGSGIDATAANTLDDYEEGTWTPTLGGSTHRNGTWSSTLGIYTKIGNIVHLYFGISGSGMYFSSELGYQHITGVPFTAANPTGYSNYSGSWSGDDVVRSSAGHVYLHTNNMYMHAANSNPSTTGVTGIGGYISYRTNS